MDKWFTDHCIHFNFELMTTKNNHLQCYSSPNIYLLLVNNPLNNAAYLTGYIQINRNLAKLKSSSRSTVKENSAFPDGIQLPQLREPMTLFLYQKNKLRYAPNSSPTVYVTPNR